jgi:hypothetical protein
MSIEMRVIDSDSYLWVFGRKITEEKLAFMLDGINVCTNIFKMEMNNFWWKKLLGDWIVDQIKHFGNCSRRLVTARVLFGGVTAYFSLTWYKLCSNCDPSKGIKGYQRS